MSTVRIKIENIEAMERFIEEQVFGKIAAKVVKNVIDDVKEFIPNVIWESFASHDIIQALLSPHTTDHDFDIKAHLGLSDADARAAVEEMESVVKKSITVKKAASTAVGVDINVKSVESNLRDSSVFSYWSHSEHGSYHIEWLKWILDGDGSAEAGIVFLNLPESRSGRAIMKDSLSSPDWHIADYDFFGGRNFITEALSNPKTKELILTKLRRSFEHHVKRI